MARTRPPGVTTSQGRRATRRETLITGYLVRLARESAPGGCSQERLSRVMAVSPDTVAGWETGRRPLAAVRAGQFVRLRSELARLGAESRIIRMLGISLDADQILDHAMEAAGRHEPSDYHPLGAHVHRREVIELAAWPLSGRIPAGLAAPAARRGPVAPKPELAVAVRDAVFDHLRRVADTSGSEELLRRQALYLQSYDRRPDAAPWMAHQYRRTSRRHSGWTQTWPATRTLAVSLVRYGDPTTLIDFSHYGLADEPGQVANLNYWAYWVGEVPAIERDDSFMPGKFGRWRGNQVLRHLASRLDAPDGVADLGVHTLSTLLVARPYLLSEDPAFTTHLAVTAGQLIDSGRMTSPARQALARVCYALRLHTR